VSQSRHTHPLDVSGQKANYHQRSNAETDHGQARCGRFQLCGCAIAFTRPAFGASMRLFSVRYLG